MSYSKSVSYVKLSPNCTKPRNKKIDAIVIHHMAGNAKIESCGDWFALTSTQSSSNYGVGTDGRIACYVEEENRSWATCNGGIDNRAITIEVANCSGKPDWKVSDKALEATIALCVDICKRNGFRLNYTGDKTGNLHKHEWYATTNCPGPYLGGKFAYIAEEVNKRLDAGNITQVVKDVQNACGSAANAVANAIGKKESYTLKAFVKDVQKACGAAVDGIPGPETFSKTVTLSEHKNAMHAAVKPVQRRLYELGYTEVGVADGIAGPKFTAAVKHYQKDNSCYVDGEITARNKTWKKLLGMA